MKTRIATFLSKPRVQLACRLIIGGIFIYASADKIINPRSFAQAVANYKILPGPLINSVALFLPWFELICGTCLVLGFFKRTVSILLTGLLALFISALIFNLARGLDINCGCFGSTESTLAEALLKDLFLLFPCIVIVLYSKPGNMQKIPLKQ